MRTLVSVLVIMAVALAGVAYFNRELISFIILKVRLTPLQQFSEATAPPVPDYTDPKSWAALPDQADGADLSIPGKIVDNQANAPADVFFVLPTTYLKPDGWNGPIGDRDANRFIAEQMLPDQASAFNGCCKIYAPRYRQATFASFMDKKGNGEKAYALAYRDVEAAFDYYLSHFNKGRPFILAGHAQGSRHVISLIKARISGTPLAKQMIAAYAIGWPINEVDYKAAAPDVPICSDEAQSGCLVSWNSVGARARDWPGHLSDVCVNPLTWRTDGALAPATLNHGALVLRDGVRDIEVNGADGQCISGRLVIKDLRAQALVKSLTGPIGTLGREVFHAIDYQLYYMNLRENAGARVARVVLADGPAPATKAPAKGH